MSTIEHDIKIQYFPESDILELMLKDDAMHKRGESSTKCGMSILGYYHYKWTPHNAAEDVLKLLKAGTPAILAERIQTHLDDVAQNGTDKKLLLSGDLFGR